MHSGYMAFKGTYKIAIIASKINQQVYINIQGKFLIPLKYNRFANNEVIFQGDNEASCRAKVIQAFLQGVI